MLLIKAMWFGCKHVAYNLELNVQLGVGSVEVEDCEFSLEVSFL